MLTFLTGAIQTGKTRWLLHHAEELEADGVQVCGVIAPGTWIDHGNLSPERRFEKTGIDALLLPSRETVPFARRDDLARSAGSFDEGSQAAQAGLRWAIDDRAIARVNEHFSSLAAIEEPARRLLVVDELGMLELERGGGFTQAVSMINRGATPAFRDALVVVREALLERACTAFSQAPWDGIRVIRPNEPAP